MYKNGSPKQNIYILLSFQGFCTSLLARSQMWFEPVFGFPKTHAISGSESYSGLILDYWNGHMKNIAIEKKEWKMRASHDCL